MNKNVIIGIVVVVVLVVGGIFGYQALQLKRATDAANAPAGEIVKSEFNRDGAVTKMHFEGWLDAPMERTEKALWNLEESAGKIKTVKLSQLVSSEGNVKVLNMQVQVLNLPINAATMKFTLDAPQHRVTFETVKSAAQDVKGSYALVASPDGKRTRVVYEATATDKIAVPLPASVLEGAAREMFVELMRGMKRMVQ